MVHEHMVYEYMVHEYTVGSAADRAVGLFDLVADRAVQLIPARDEELVVAASRGDNNAWKELVGSYAGLVWAITRNHDLGVEDASYVSQIAWLRLAENLDRLPDPSRVGDWLATTTRRECLGVIGQSRPAPAHDPGAQR